ncbi:amino acid adenylation domain-containing protein [Paenibacillus tritici]|uniref:non-ribosomal peptide synthetase n=1 Tax=Paenibacillus tritici TaxID=1873425 RepID=UPI001BABB097|nr:non-ribosomal peptide synthetase [Paenibacillus tritici]QUL52224.1 amino acid adenylation domain-containing protein [Paenibacillus tritici]
MAQEDMHGDSKYYSLSHPQKRVWVVDKIHSGSSLHNIGGTIRINGPVQLDLMEQAIHLFIRKHDGIRLRFTEGQDGPCQYVPPYQPFPLDRLDFSQCSEPEQEFQKWSQATASTPFDLEDASLFYFALFRISESEMGYFSKFHHLIADGWSMNVMTEQIGTNYERLCYGHEIEDESSYSYLNYLDTEQRYLESSRFLKDKAFWIEQLQDLEDSSARNSQSLEGNRSVFELSLELSGQIKEFTDRYGCSGNSFFTAVYLLYASIMLRQTDLLLGIPVLNRSGRREKSAFGMFTSTMPFRFLLNYEETVGQMIARVHRNIMDGLFHQKYPFDLLTGDVKFFKQHHSSLFQACINWYNTSLAPEINGFSVKNEEFYNGLQQYQLQLVIKSWSASGALSLQFDYQKEAYSEEQIEDMYRRIVHLIKQACTNPLRPVGSLSLLSEDEEHYVLYDFNSTAMKYDPGKSVITMFEEQAARSPDKIAVCFGNESLTYSQLNKKSNQLAGLLSGFGAGRGTVTGLFTVHSMESIIGILAVMKAGGAYIPLDPSYPADRIRFILDEAAVSVLLINCEWNQAIAYNGRIIDLNDSALYEGQEVNPGISIHSNDLAYVIYTSGSTGVPKGTMIEHQGLSNYVSWAAKMYFGPDEEVVPLYSSLAFDLTVTSIFAPLVSGNLIVIYRDDEEEFVLFRVIKDNKATVLKLTPAHLSLIQDQDFSCSAIRRFIVGGDMLSTELARKVQKYFKQQQVQIYNEYGPTETVVGCMIHQYNPNLDNGASVPIGRPAGNVQIYILDRGGNPVPPYAIGELYISGQGVARGYLNRTELSQEKFVDNPFIPGQRMYRTGDLARFISGGIIEYIGRADYQVKIRGYRIEPGEIENRLLQHTAIREASVKDWEDSEQGRYLCAYLVKSGAVSSEELREYLLTRIPEYMVPSFFVELEELPLTGAGKLNRSSLPKPVRPERMGTGGDTSLTAEEEILYRVIAEVMHLETVRGDDHFFTLGGDSIKAIQIASKLSAAGFTIRIKDLLTAPLLREMARHVHWSGRPEAGQQPAVGIIQPTPILSWFLAQEFPDLNQYNQSLMLLVKQSLKVEQLERMILEIISHHDIFRMNYNAASGHFYYNKALPAPSGEGICFYDLGSFPIPKQDELIREIGTRMKQSFDISSGVLLRAGLFHLGERGIHVLLTAHHLAVDIVSWGIILEDMSTMLRQMMANDVIQLPSKTHSFQEWSLSLERYGQSLHEAQYTDLLERTTVVHFSNECELTPEGQVPVNHSLQRTMDTGNTGRLMNEANQAYHTQTNDLLLAALAVMCTKYWPANEISVELEGHGREDIDAGIDISRTVGWFTCMYPVVLQAEGTDLAQQIIAVKEQIRSVSGNKIDYGVMMNRKGYATRSPGSSIRFNYLGDLDQLLENEHFKAIPVDTGPDIGEMNTLQEMLDFNVYILNRRLTVSLTCSSKHYSEEQLVAVLEYYLVSLANIIEHCSGKQAPGFTPSDFPEALLTQSELDSLFAKLE